METTKKKIQVQARVRIVSTVKGQELTRPENFNPIVEIDRSSIFHAQVAQAEVETATRYAFVSEFRTRMRNDPALRHKIGGIRWSVDLIHYNYKDAI